MQPTTDVDPTLMKATIKKLSYPDFVALLGQKNTPPGGLFTVEKTAELAGINQASVALDLACSTGFSSREIVRKFGCRAVGFDISSDSIRVAQEEGVKAGLSDKLEYHVMNAEELSFSSDTFTHVLSGCNFSFIDRRDKALKEAHRVLAADGQLCVANFFYHETPPESMLDSVADTIGFRPEGHWDREWWLRFFSQHFRLETEEVYTLPVQTEKELRESIRQSLELSDLLSNASEEVFETCFERLFLTRSVLNEHRKYQKYNITIWSPNA